MHTSQTDVYIVVKRFSVATRRRGMDRTGYLAWDSDSNRRGGLAVELVKDRGRCFYSIYAAKSFGRSNGGLTLFLSGFCSVPCQAQRRRSTA